MRTLILGRNNISNTDNSRFTYYFNPNINIADMSIAIASLIIPYSWETVNTRYNNKTFQIIYNGTTYTLTLDNGAYSVADINAYIQYWCVKNNLLYCVSASGQYIYFIELIDNPVTYSYELRSYPTVLPAGATNVGGWTMNGYCPQLVIPSTNNFGKIIGFNAGTYPSTATQNTNYTKASDYAPSPSPINQIIVNCSLVNNKALQVSSNNVIWTFAVANTGYGENITINPSEYAWVRCIDGSVSSVDIWLSDQDGNILTLKDPNSLVMLLLKQESS